jgi:hypothetical protein
MSEPKPIKTCAGECIKVLLGKTGAEFFAFESFQTSRWSAQSWNVAPRWNDFVKALSDVKRRRINSISIGHDGEWFISVDNIGKPGSTVSCGGVSIACRDQILDLGRFSRPPLHVAFGGNDCYVRVHNGKECFFGSNVPSALKTKVNELKSAEKKKLKVHFLPGGGYVLRSPTLTACKVTGAYELLQQELTKSSEEIDNVLDVCVAGDGSWIVVRRDGFSVSDDTHEDTLAALYANHNERRKAREDEITRYQRAKKEEVAYYQEQDGTRREKDEVSKRWRRIHDALSDIESKGLKVGDKVTVAGFSRDAGDAVIKGFDATGPVSVTTAHSGSTWIEDPRRIIKYSSGTIPSVWLETALVAADDKYEVASALAEYFYPEYEEHDRGEHYVFSVTTVQTGIHSESSSSKMAVLEHRGEVLPFDEYKCAERIDLKRLKQTVDDLARDSSARKQMIQHLWPGDTSAKKSWLAKLQSCNDLELVATRLYDELKDHQTDMKNCVVYEVTYEHRDQSQRGRIFANGSLVHLSKHKFPRTLTLQGMHGDLRAPLVGSFAHDVDCENSEVRLLCSLSKQYKLEDLVPILFDYRDKRTVWIRLIAELHNVSEAAAKRMTSIIISGGRYETWLKKFGVSEPRTSTPEKSRLRTFVFELSTQIRLLQDQLLKHPRFRWTLVDRQKIEERGRRRGQGVDDALLTRIIMSCENEVLRILHRSFHKRGWIVRAKIYDGLIVEPGSKTAPVLPRLVSAMRLAEKACLEQGGWDVVLAQEPLYGREDDPIPAIVEARAALKEALGSVRI